MTTRKFNADGLSAEDTLSTSSAGRAAAQVRDGRYEKATAPTVPITLDAPQARPISVETMYLDRQAWIKLCVDIESHLRAAVAGVDRLPFAVQTMVDLIRSNPAPAEFWPEFNTSVLKVAMAEARRVR